jgi:RimJ/RimL family protein N-acetyltransferase
MNFPTVLPILTTPRLTLRALTMDDVDAIFAIYSHAEVMRYWSDPPMTEPQQAVAIIDDATQGFAAQRALTWAIVLRADGPTGQLIGRCTLFGLDAQNRRCELGYLLHHAAWGQGFAQEALRAVLDYGFGALNLHRVETDIDPRNHASVRLATRLGFRKEGLLRERWIVDGETSDSLMMGLLAPEWYAQAGHAQAADHKPT